MRRPLGDLGFHFWEGRVDRPPKTGGGGFGKRAQLTVILNLGRQIHGK